MFMTWAGRLVRTRILADQNATGYTPNINSEVLPETLGTAFATGNFNRVPIVNGTNRDEWRLFVALGELAGNPSTHSCAFWTALEAG